MHLVHRFLEVRELLRESREINFRTFVSFLNVCVEPHLFFPGERLTVVFCYLQKSLVFLIDYSFFEYEYMKIICELRIKTSEIVILAVCFQLKQLKKQPEKKFRLERDSNPRPCNTGAMLYPLSYQTTWIAG